jgi:hypothetical protein
MAWTRQRSSHLPPKQEERARGGPGPATSTCSFVNYAASVTGWSRGRRRRAGDGRRRRRVVVRGSPTGRRTPDRATSRSRPALPATRPEAHSTPSNRCCYQQYVSEPVVRPSMTQLTHEHGFHPKDGSKGHSTDGRLNSPRDRMSIPGIRRGRRSWSGTVSSSLPRQGGPLLGRGCRDCSRLRRRGDCLRQTSAADWAAPHRLSTIPHLASRWHHRPRASSRLAVQCRPWSGGSNRAEIAGQFAGGVPGRHRAALRRCLAGNGLSSTPDPPALS